MNEYGHNAINGCGFHIDVWGAGPFEMLLKGKVHRFEDSDRFGPTRLSKRGEVLDWWSEKHSFWRAHRQWVQQGRQLAPDGKTCVVTLSDPQPTLWYRDGRRKVVLEFGDEDGGAREVPKPEPFVITIGDVAPEAQP